jgi:phage tail-like protein
MPVDISVQRAGKDPILQCDFIVEIQGLVIAGFMEFSEPQKSKGKPTYREGNSPNRVFKQNGLETIADVTLKRGIFAEEDYLYNWYMSGERKTIDVVCFKHGRDGDRRVKTYRFYEILPNDYKAGKGDAMSEDGIMTAELLFTAEDWDINP